IHQARFQLTCKIPATRMVRQPPTLDQMQLDPIRALSSPVPGKNMHLMTLPKCFFSNIQEALLETTKRIILKQTQCELHLPASRIISIVVLGHARGYTGMRSQQACLQTNSIPLRHRVSRDQKNRSQLHELHGHCYKRESPSAPTSGFLTCSTAF